MHSQNTPIKFSPFDGGNWTGGKCSGAEYRDVNPTTVWNYNPWTGTGRTSGDMWHDPMGKLIIPPGEDIAAAPIKGARQVVFGPPTRNMAPAYVQNPSATKSALHRQEGGDHYKDMPIQPVEFIHANAIGYFEGNVIKYVARWRKKNGVADLEKARHYIDLLIQLESKK
jgi:hypothetical protein